MTMLRRILCILLALSLTLACTGAAFAEPLDDVVEMEFTTYPEAPQATPTATPSAAPTSDPSASPYASATPDPSASPDASATPAPTPTPTATPIAPLSVGSRGTEVAELQAKLSVLGFSCDAADGIYGERTYEAVSRLQSYLVLLNSRALVSYTRLSTGVADSALLGLIKSGVPTYYSTLSYGSTGTQVTRLQYRLSSLDYMLSNGIDGIFGVTTQAALKDFQTTNGLEATGTADKATQELLFSTLAKKCADPNARYPYKLIVDVSEQRVYVYEYSNGAYTKLKARFVCSTGTKANPTPLGTYRSTERIDEWHYFVDYNCWAQYAYRIVGRYYFHSVLFKEKGGSPTSSSVRNLGRRASHGCVRLSVADAKWIYDNCPKGTTVVVRD